MNYGMIAYVLGWILSMEAMLLVPAGITAIVYREKEGLAILITILICLIPGVIRLFVKPRKKQIYAKEGLVITSLSWLLLSLFGALPFRISGHIPHMVDAVFETASGFTTTGASILTDVEALPHCLLFWRSFTHWVGGMGILVFLIAVLPMAGNGSDMFLMDAVLFCRHKAMAFGSDHRIFRFTDILRTDARKADFRFCIKPSWRQETDPSWHCD